MFLGFVVFAILAAIVATVVLRTLRKIVRRLTGKKTDKPKEDKKKDKKPSVSESQKENKENEIAKEETAHEEQPQLELSEDTRGRYEAAVSSGISEAFSPEDADFQIDEKALADECVADSSLSYLEYHNRELAGDDFHGFNLIVEHDSRMVLTYCGSAVASMTKVERKATAIINGETVSGTMPGFRINTFPPELKPGMTVTDLETMLVASDCIKGIGGDPSIVAIQMIGFFTDPKNTAKLKGSIDRKIQSKESVRKSKENSQRQAQKGPRKLSR